MFISICISNDTDYRAQIAPSKEPQPHACEHVSMVVRDMDHTTG